MGTGSKDLAAYGVCQGLDPEHSDIVESLYSGHYWEPTFCLLLRGVPNSGTSGIFPAGVVLHNQAVEHNVDTK